MSFALDEFTLEGMNAWLYGSVADFAPVARWVYRRDPVLFTSELTTLRSSSPSSDQIMLSVAECDGRLGAAVSEPGGALLVSGLLPSMAKVAAAGVSSVRDVLPGIRGTRSSATAFAEAWSCMTGADPSDVVGMTLYRLDELAPPTGVPGCSRLAEPDDAELLVDWLDGFFVEACAEAPDREGRKGFLQRVFAVDGQIVIWSADGEPVSMARIHAPAAGMSRIGQVYTPPGSRGRGYGAAATTSAAELAYSRGARHVALFADAVNPGAHRIYRRLGFVPVAETLEFGFAA